MGETPVKDKGEREQRASDCNAVLTPMKGGGKEGGLAKKMMMMMMQL